MPKNNKGRGAPPPKKGPARGRGGAIHKASHNSSSGALGAAIAAARSQLQQGSGGGSLHLARLSQSEKQEEETTVETILALVRECVNDADGGLALSALGDGVRALGNRRGHFGIHKTVKDKWGHWEQFLRQHASDM